MYFFIVERQRQCSDFWIVVVEFLLMDKSIAAVEDSQNPKILGSNVRITRKKGQNKFVAHLSSSLVFKYLML